jgi:hypothetical protein
MSAIFGHPHSIIARASSSIRPEKPGSFPPPSAHRASKWAMLSGLAAAIEKVANYIGYLGRPQARGLL